MTAIRQALIEQHPSLELQRSAHSAICQLDAQLATVANELLKTQLKLRSATELLEQIDKDRLLDDDTQEAVSQLLVFIKDKT